MKGTVHAEFLDLIDSRFGPEMTEIILARTGAAPGQERAQDQASVTELLEELSVVSGLGMRDLVHSFGRHILERLVVLFPEFFAGVEDAPGFLEKLDSFMHQEVRKHYASGELPRIATERLIDGRFLFHYLSERRMDDLAEGLIAGAIAHFGQRHSYRRQDVATPGTAQCVKFILSPVC